MEKSNLLSLLVTQDTTLDEIKNVSSFTVTNYGSSVLILEVNGISREVPAFDSGTYPVPVGCFTMDGDGTFCDIRLGFKFLSGKGIGKAILDYRVIQSNNPNCS